jgi:hypothetical protein
VITATASPGCRAGTASRTITEKSTCRAIAQVSSQAPRSAVRAGAAATCANYCSESPRCPDHQRRGRDGQHEASRPAISSVVAYAIAKAMPPPELRVAAVRAMAATTARCGSAPSPGDPRAYNERAARAQHD